MYVHRYIYKHDAMVYCTALYYTIVLYDIILELAIQGAGGGHSVLARLAGGGGCDVGRLTRGRAHVLFGSRACRPSF